MYDRKICVMRRLGGFMNFEGMGTYLCDCRKVVHMSDEKAEKQGCCNYCEHRRNNASRGSREKIAPDDAYKGKEYGMYKLTGEYMSVASQKCLKYKAICQECGAEKWSTIASFYKNTVCKCVKPQDTRTLYVGEKRGVYEIIKILGKNEHGQREYRWKCTECGSEFDRTPGHFRKDVKCTCHRKGVARSIKGQKVGVYIALGSEKVMKAHVYVFKCTICGKIHASTRAKPTYKDKCYCNQKVARRDYSEVLNKYKK